MTTHYSPAPPKGALKSKSVIGGLMAISGAVIPVLASMGWLPFDIYFDPQTGMLSINVYSVGGMLASGLTLAGGPLALIGRLVGKRAIRGLW